MAKMKKIIIVLICAALVAALGVSCNKKEQKPEGLTLKEGVLTVGMEIGYPPMEYFDTDGKTLIGFDADLSKALADKLGLKFEYVDTAWDGIFAGVNTGKYDCIISSVTYSPERDQAFDLTKPYITNSQILVVRKDSPVKPKSMDDLKGLRLTYQGDTTSDMMATEWQKNSGIKLEVFPYDKVMNCFDDLSLKRADVILVDKVVADWYMSKPDNPFEVSAQVSNNEVFVICLKKGNDALRDALNNALDELFADGTLKKISIDTFGIDVVSSLKEQSAETAKTGQ